MDVWSEGERVLTNSVHAPEGAGGQPINVSGSCSSAPDQDDLLRAVDLQLVAELMRRVEIWMVLTGQGVRASDASEPQLSGDTIRELLSVIDSLTRRESARHATVRCSRVHRTSGRFSKGASLTWN